MARHRSPKGRRAHLGPPLPVPAAGVGGAHRPTPAPTAFPSRPVRFVATAVAGGALATVGQHALVANLPATADGSNVLRLGVQQILGAPAATVDAAAAMDSTEVVPVVAAQPLATLAPVLTEPDAPAVPDVVEARDLVKAADMQRKAITPDAESLKVGAPDRPSRSAAVAAREEAEAATPDAAERSPGDAAGTTDEAEQRGPAEKAEEVPDADGAKAAGDDAEVDTSSLAGGAIQMITGRVTSGFGARWGVFHEGLDIAAPIGTPIRVPLPGTVIDSGPASGFGLWVRVRHADGTVTTYGHVNRSFVTTGEQVSAGQEIAEVGNRGHSTGPHLHIEVTTPAGTKINPRPWLDQHGIGY